MPVQLVSVMYFVVSEFWKGALLLPMMPPAPWFSMTISMMCGLLPGVDVVELRVAAGVDVVLFEDCRDDPQPKAIRTLPSSTTANALLRCQKRVPASSVPLGSPGDLDPAITWHDATPRPPVRNPTLTSASAHLTGSRTHQQVVPAPTRRVELFAL